jgi:hypothetical protein
MRRLADDTRSAAVHHRCMPQGSSPARDRGAVRRTLIASAAVAAFAVGAILVSVTSGHDVGDSSPQDTVRDFLVTSVIDGDGVDACGYLTPRAALALDESEPRDTTCHEALTDTQLTLGSERVDDEAQVKHLDYGTRLHGAGATVTVSAGGGAMAFELGRATAAERAETRAPATPWRIDSAVDRLAVR